MGHDWSMRPSICLLSFFVFACACLTHAAERSFTNSSGKQITAELLRVEGEGAVLSVKGREFTVPIASLSETDQTFITNWQREKEAAAAEAKAAMAEQLKLVGTIKDEMVILNRRDLEAYQIASPDNIEILSFYTSASECTLCQAFNPKL